MRFCTKTLSQTIYGRFLAMSFLALAVSHCTPEFEGEYADPAKAEIVDDRWNETDARKTAEAQIKGMLDKAWLKDYTKAAKGKKPMVIVDEIENRTDEHIDTKALTEYVRDELINSGQVRFLDKAGREKILDELKYQGSGAVAKEKAIQAGRQLGAQFMLSGAISSSVHSQGKLKTVTYQTLMILTNLETAEIEWSEKYPIKKRFNRSGSKW